MTYEIAILSIQGVTLAVVIWILYLFRKQRRYIGSLSSDAVRAQSISPEVVSQWWKEYRKHGKGSAKHRAYRNKLIEIGELDPATEIDAPEGVIVGD